MYEGKKVLVGLSGGINSMAVLCWLYETGERPAELHLFYAHLAEHSPDTFRFVVAGIRFARKHFPCVKVKITRNSVLAYFQKHNMIPHPARSTCSYWLKIKPMEQYCQQHGITVDLVGFIRSEQRRIDRIARLQDVQPGAKAFPIQSFDNAWCFEMVRKYIGWYPAIYDIVENGKPVFKHNNCLPCKNMHLKDMKAVQQHFPRYMHNAQELSRRLKAYWGRDADAYYTEFGRQDYEPEPCAVCRFD